MIFAESTALVAVVFAVAGMLLVVGVAAIFYVIGRGEDRQREQERERAAPPPPREPPRRPRRTRFRRRP